jgi:hypothetical protein
MHKKTKERRGRAPLQQNAAETVSFGQHGIKQHQQLDASAAATLHFVSSQNNSSRSTLV